MSLPIGPRPFTTYAAAVAASASKQSKKKPVHAFTQRVVVPSIAAPMNPPASPQIAIKHNDIGPRKFATWAAAAASADKQRKKSLHALTQGVAALSISAPMIPLAILQGEKLPATLIGVMAGYLDDEQYNEQIAAVLDAIGVGGVTQETWNAVRLQSTLGERAAERIIQEICKQKNPEITLDTIHRLIHPEEIGELLYLEHIPNLDSIFSNAKVGFKKPILDFLLKYCPNLRELSYQSYELSEAIIQQFAGFKHLHTLSFTRCTIGEELAESIATHLKHLSHLHFIDCPDVGDGEIDKITLGVDKLISLHLIDCRGFTNEAVRHIADNSLRIQDLVIQNCSGIKHNCFHEYSMLGGIVAEQLCTLTTLTITTNPEFSDFNYSYDDINELFDNGNQFGSYIDYGTHVIFG